MKLSMRMKWLIWLTMFLATVQTTMSQSTQTFQVKGVLQDSITGEGEPYATIRVTKKGKPERPVKMMVSDMKGVFQEKVAGTGEFVIDITSVGRTPIRREFTVKAGEGTVDLGVLLVTDASTILGTVEVVAQKPLVKADIDKIAYNIQDDPDSESNSVLEMLRKVPLVTVDGEDNIQVNGSSSFKVYVNGKPNNMMSNNPTEVLKSMPANSIKHIEVITNPGPKYDAEGVGGILNIVTTGSGMEGYTVTLSGQVTNQFAGGGLFGTVQKGKLTVSGRYNYNHNRSPRYYSGSTQENTPAQNGVERIVSYGTGKGSQDFQSGSLEASYEIDTLQLLSMSFGLWGGGQKGDSEGEFMAYPPMSSPEGALYRYTEKLHNKSSWFSIDGGLDYQRSSAKVKERMLTLSYKIDTQPQTSESRSVYDIDENYDPSWETFLRRLNDQRTDGEQNTMEHTFQADYTTPVGRMHTLEGGVKYILRNNTSEDDLFRRPVGSEDAYEQDMERTSHYKHLNDILAAYAGYGLTIKKFSGRLGLRYEYTAQDVKYALAPERDFTKDYDDLIPSVSLGWKLTDMSNLRLGYNMRIWRPGIYALNPYLDDSNPNYITQGNSRLDSEKSHAFDLSYSNFSMKFNLNMALRYTFTNNGIEQTTTLMNDRDIEGMKHPTGQQVLYSSWDNIGKSRNFRFSGYANWNPTSSTRIYVNLFCGYSYYELADGERNDGWQCFFYGGIQQTLPKDWNIALNYIGQTPWISSQGKGNSFSDYTLRINKSFLNKRLTLSAYAGNIFTKYNDFSRRTTGEGFRHEAWNRISRQRFGVSVSYRLGELKAGVKKAARSISNDDVKESGQGGGQGSGQGE